MLEREVMGHTVIECSSEEARLIWKRKPELRPLLWAHAEIDAHLLSDPGTLAQVIERKRQNPGSCI
jgi:hypothetical protein